MIISIICFVVGFFLGIFLMTRLFTAKAPPPMIDESERWHEIAKGMGYDAKD